MGILQNMIQHCITNPWIALRFSHQNGGGACKSSLQARIEALKRESELLVSFQDVKPVVKFTQEFLEDRQQKRLSAGAVPPRL